MDWVEQERKTYSVFNPFDQIPNSGVGNIILEYHMKEDILYRYYRMRRSKRSWKKLGIHEFFSKNKGMIFLQPEDWETFKKNFCQGQCNSMAVRVREIEGYGWYHASFKKFYQEGELIKVSCILNKIGIWEDLDNEYALFKAFREDKKQILQLISDMAEEKKQQDILEKNIQKKKRAIEVRDDFMHSFSLEIQNALNAIIGKSDILLMEEISGETAEQLKTIRNISYYLSKAVSDILDFVNIAPQRFQMLLSNYQMSSVLLEIYNIVRTPLEERSLKLFFDIDRNVPDYFIGDRVKICQILQFFILSSIRFTTEGSITVKVEGDRKTDNEFFLHISIIDTGISMEERIIRNTDFFDWDKSEENPYQSLGVEMLISRKLAQLMGGDVTIKCKHGQGTQVHITLIQKVWKENLILQKIEKPLHILILDNDSMVVQHIVWLMKQLETSYTICKEVEDVKTEVDYTHVLLRSQMLLENRKELEMMFGRKRIIVLMNQSDNNSIFLKNYQQILIPFMCIQLPVLLNHYHTSARNPKSMLRTGRVLVVGDNSEHMEIILSHLHRYPLKTDVANCKRKILEYLQGEIYDLVLMDMDMEGLCGIEMISYIRSSGGLYLDMPVIALTAESNIGVLEELIHMGFQDFLVKPLEASEVSRIIKTYVSIKDLHIDGINIEETPSQNYPCVSLLGKLKTACESMEYDFAEEIVLDMLRFTYPQKIKENLYAMIACLEEFDYDEFDRLSDELLTNCE